MQFRLTPAYQLSAALMGVSIVLVQSQVAVSLSSAEVAQVAKAITVRIESQTGSQGSGIIIKREGDIYFVLTADHVVSRSGQYKIITPDDESYQLDFKTKKSKSGTDLAVVQFNSSKTYSVAKIGNSDKSTEGTIVYVAGFPTSTSTVTSSKLYRFLEGKITANASQPLDEGYSLVYSNSTLPGMSGGPVLNDRGEVIAVHGRAETTAQGSGESVKAVSTGNNLGISVNTFLRLALLDTGVRAPTQTIASAPKADNFYLQGVDKYYQGDFPGAIEQFSKAIEVNPKYANAYTYRGVLYKEQKQYEKAIADYTRVIEIDRQNINAYLARGVIYYEQKDYDKALADFNHAIDLNPQDSEIYNIRGFVYTKQKQYEKAIADFNHVLKIDPKNVGAYNGRGLVYYELKKVDAAISDWRKTISFDKQFAAPQLALAVALYTRGDFQESLRLGAEAIRLDSILTDLQLIKEKFGWGDLLLKDTEKFFKEPQIRALLN